MREIGEKRAICIPVIGVLEICIGLYGLWQVYLYMNDQGRDPFHGTEFLFLWVVTGLSLFFVVGIGILVRSKVAWIVNKLLLYLALFTCAGMILHPLDPGVCKAILLCVLFSFFVLHYTFRRAVKDIYFSRLPKTKEEEERLEAEKLKRFREQHGRMM
jgi:hypothetical protein